MPAPAGSATRTTVNNGAIEFVDSTGRATSTTINSGGTQEVDSAGTAIATGIVTSATLNGGAQTVGVAGGTGIASGTTINGGSQYLGFFAGVGIASGTMINGDTQIVGFQGGTASVTRIINGQQFVGDNLPGGIGTAISTTIGSSGYQEVVNGNAVSTTISAGGTQVVDVGGAAFGVQIFGGTQFDSGLVSGTRILSGGSQVVEIGASASDTTVSRGGVLIVSSGSLTGQTAIQSGGLARINGGTIGAGALVETLVSGIAVVSGTVQNSGGTLLASGTGGFIEILDGGVVSGGAVEIGNGLVNVLSGGTADVFFTPTGSGELRIADAVGSSMVYTGAVSGFGGVGHSNQKQFIELFNVQFVSGALTLSYTSTGVDSGTLSVSSGGQEVADINFVGSYTSANFQIGSGPGGHLKITDPQVVNGAVVLDGVAQAFPRNGLDLPNIAFGARTTLAYAENAAGTGGILTVSDGRHATSIALLGNYMAGSFVTAADGHGGTLVKETSQAGQQPLLTHPHA